MWTWVAHWLGLDNGSGPIYLWWSGVFSALPSFGVVGLLYGLYRRHNCHVRWCPRVGHHEVEGTGWVVCRRHHPELPNTAPTAAAVSEQWRIQRGGFGVPSARVDGSGGGDGC